MSDLKQTLPSSTRALPFTNDPTTIETITTSADVVFTLDKTNAADGTTVSLSVLQNHSVDFPANFIELAGSRQPVLGKINYYILARLNGSYQFIRYQSIDDAAETTNVVVGTTQLTVGTITATTVDLSWAASANATQYVLKRYTTADYSDAPVTVYSGSDLSFTDTSLSADTHYYYKINPGTTAVTGRAAFADGSTNVESGIVLWEHTFAPGDTFAYVSNLPVELNEGVYKAHALNNYYFLDYVNLSTGDLLKITFNGVVWVNGESGRFQITDKIIPFGSADITNETIILNTVITNINDTAFFFGSLNGSEFYTQSIKIEKINTERLIGNVFSYNGLNSSDYAATNAFDSITDNNLTNCFASIENPPSVFIGLDLEIAKIVKVVNIFPRNSENGNTLLTDRLLNTYIQGSNDSTNSGFVNLYNISYVTQGKFNIYSLANNNVAYRYYRLFKNDGTNLDVAEIQFYGY